MKIPEKVKDILVLVGKSDISELVWEKDGLRLDIRRETCSQLTLTEEKPGEESAEPQEAPLLINAPMVGTFYVVHPKSKQIYVTKGMKVNIGQIVGIIEAMKVYREVFSPVSGIITNILVADGQPVMYAQKLMELNQVEE